MYLSRLKLWNFRKFGSGNDELDLAKPDLEVPFTRGVNVLIGENDSGKTAIVDAIKLALDTHSGEWIRVAQEDFYRNATRLRIECRFEDLSDEEAMHFTEWLGMEGEGGNAKPYLSVIMDVSKKGNERLHYEVRAGAGDEGHRLAGEARDYLRTTYLKPLRDAKSELIPRRNSRLSQILSGHEAFEAGENEHDLERISRCLNCLFRKYFDEAFKDSDCTETTCAHQEYFYSKERKGQRGEGLCDDLKEMIDNFFGSSEYEARFGVVDQELRNILEQFKLSLSDEEAGLGGQNLLFIAAELLNLRRENWTGLRLGLIEELEAHLHPQAQMRVIEYLQEIAKTKDASDGKETKRADDANRGEETTAKEIQLILTTHSPNLGSKVKLKNLIICHDGQVFPMGANYTELAKPDYRFLERFLDVTKANLFFAKGIILVEGWAEELILPVLARKAGRDLTEKGVSIVNVGSTAFLRYCKIFQRRDGRPMNIPVAVVTDLDVKPDEESKNENGKTKKAGRRENKENKYNGQKVKTFVSPHWTSEYCIARSEQLAPYLFEAIKAAITEMQNDGRSISGVSESYENFSNGKGQDEVALRMYHDLIVRKKISKAIIAQHLAHILDDKDGISEDVLDDEDSTKYLIDAIKYVTV